MKLKFTDILMIRNNYTTEVNIEKVVEEGRSEKVSTIIGSLSTLYVNINPI